MVEKLEEFARLLRQNGIRVSVAEVMDAARAACAVGLGDPSELGCALRATMVKRAVDAPRFDELFTLFFFRGQGMAKNLDGTPLAAMLRREGLGEDEVERILALLGDHVARLGAVATSLLGLSNAEIAQLLRIAGRQSFRMFSPLQVGYFTYQLMTQLGLPEAEREVEELLASLTRALGEREASLLLAGVKANVTRLRQAIRQHVEDEFQRQNLGFQETYQEKVLTRKPFSQLTPSEIVRLRVEVKKLANKLKIQASLRPKVRRRGRLDVRRTLRKSLASDGVPFQLAFRMRRVEKPRLVVLCDISDSVRNVSRFMLEFVYTLQELFGHVRSFVFVSDLGEATALFRSSDIDSAVRRAYGGEVISVSSNSNYGRALRVFTSRYASSVTPKTTVIIIGDARTNYLPPESHLLAQVRRRAKRVIWLNPEPPPAWGFGDSAMREYEPHCDRVEVSYHLESLKKVVGDLVL